MALGWLWRRLVSHFAWQAWHLWHWAGSGGALGFRRGAGDAAAVGVAAVALGDIHLRFTWQAWYLVTSTSRFCFLFVSSSGAVSVVFLCCSPSCCPVRPEALLEIVLGRLPCYISQSVTSCPQMGCVGTLGLTKGFSTMTFIFFFFRVHLRSMKAAS